MEILAMRRQIYKEPYTIKYNNTFRYSAFKNRHIKSITACKSAVIVIRREEEFLQEKHNTKKKNLQLQREEFMGAPNWKEKFNENIFLYKQKQKPEYKEAVFISKIIMERLSSKVFEEVFISYKAKNRNQKELVLVKILPVDPALSFVLPKYLESIIFGILLEAYAS